MASKRSRKAPNSASAPYEPTRESFRISKTRSREKPPPNASKASATASSWNAPVSRASTSSAVTTATGSGRWPPSTHATRAVMSPTSAPTTGNQLVAR